jgi:hypothetical protein
MIVVENPDPRRLYAGGWPDTGNIAARSRRPSSEIAGFQNTRSKMNHDTRGRSPELLIVWCGRGGRSKPKPFVQPAEGQSTAQRLVHIRPPGGKNFARFPLRITTLDVFAFDGPDFLDQSGVHVESSSIC